MELASAGRGERMHRLSVDFETEPALLGRFVTEGQEVLKGGKVKTLHLAGHGKEPN